MKDHRGVYYYPFPQNKHVRMYVRPQDDDVAFRLWNDQDPQLWEQHGWVPYTAVQQAAAMYANTKAFNPHQAYDIQIAREVLKDTEST